MAPLLLRIYENAKKNSRKNSNRHDLTVKNFSLALLILTGKAGYELLQRNLGDALPAYSTLQRMLGKKERMEEGKFYFEELMLHLKEWKAPKYVHIQLDDTRIINKVVYDAYTDRYVGFILPLIEGLPVTDSFILHTFEEIERAYNENKNSLAKYAHCIVVESVEVAVPSFVLAVIGTDSKYDNVVVSKRWNHMRRELEKLGITVVSYGSDGAGPFLKSMLTETELFVAKEGSNVPSTWNFFVMPSIKVNGLCAQDHVHLLAKLRSRILGPSNLIVLGAETACPAHLRTVCNNIPKERHGLTKKVIDNKDKQNYTSIAVLVGDELKACLTEMEGVIRPKGTIIYLTLMRKLRDAFFEKAMRPIDRISSLWEVVFFLRIWRCWLSENGYSETEHFLTTNAYTCIELNAHFMLSLVFNVIKGIFPKEVLRVWITGSQGCEQLFRLVRSMTPIFSTIINFSLKQLLERIHRLSFISSLECTDEIIFPRVQRRLLQLNEEADSTFIVPTIEEIETTICNAKQSAIITASQCKMHLSSYDDKDLVQETTILVADAVENDLEDEEVCLEEDENRIEQERNLLDSSTVVEVREDLAVINLRKKRDSSFPTYVESSEKGTDHDHSYSSVITDRHSKKKKTPFVKFKGAFIRKTTALYLLQENTQLSNDRLLRVRSSQPSHIFGNSDSSPEKSSDFVHIGDLCLFRQLGSEKVLLGRVIQFSYLSGSKKEREFSGTYVDMKNESYKNIGVYANWFARRIIEEGDFVHFEALDLVFTTGYHSMEHFVGIVDDLSIACNPSATLAIKCSALDELLPDWNELLSIIDEIN